MPDETDQSKSRPAPKRNRLLVRFLIVLLMVNFVLVYTKPGWLLIPGHGQRGTVRSRIARLPGMNMLPGVGGPRGPRGDRVMEENGRRLLWAGDDKSDHFDITNFHLDAEALRYGLGREAFAALIEPTFVSAADADTWLEPSHAVLAVKIGDEVKVYPLRLLQHHEVVNDTVGGKPIFAAWCYLARLGAVYERTVGEHTLTFAVSGYTYGDGQTWGGDQAFVLWDRDTESLWWPPIGKAVSGPLMDTPMKILDTDLWAQSDWATMREKYPDAQVLKPRQKMERPDSWHRLDIQTPTTRPTTVPADAIAPTWGKNADL
jgi:hypothetical protein